MENLVVHLVLCMDTAGSGGREGCRKQHRAPKTRNPHRIVTHWQPHRDGIREPHSLACWDYFNYNIFEMVPFSQIIAFIRESPFKHDCSLSDSESTGRVRGNLAIWGPHCISQSLEKWFDHSCSPSSQSPGRRLGLPTASRCSSRCPQYCSAWLQSCHHTRIKGLEPSTDTAPSSYPPFSLLLATAFDTLHTP